MLREARNSVTLEGYFGGDLTHALAAWTSTERSLTDERRGRVDRLLAMLAGSDPQHTVPFEKSYLQFLVTADTASHIHLLKHRVAVSINGESARYKEHTEDKFYVPDDWPRENQKDLAEYVRAGFALYHSTIGSLEESGFSRKRAKESARFYLPYASQVHLDVSFNFLSFTRFQRLRNDDQAQDEIHWIAEEMRRLVQETGEFDDSLRAWGLWRDLA